MKRFGAHAHNYNRMTAGILPWTKRLVGTEHGRIATLGSRATGWTN
jgi:hypothetical protein